MKASAKLDIIDSEPSLPGMETNHYDEESTETQDHSTYASN